MTAAAARDWFRSVPVADGLTLVTEPFVHDYFRANIWHLRGRDADLLIDSGMGLRPLAPQIASGGRPLIAVATHVHVDHVGGLHEFADRAGPARSADAFASMPDGSTLAHLFRDLDQPVSRSPAKGWSARDYRVMPAPLTRRLAEGDVIDLGDRRFTVIELPGHSPDGIGLLDEADGLFFSGDAIYDDMLVDDLPGSDRAAYRQTMERLRLLPVHIAHGGHGPSFDAARLRVIADGYLARDIQLTTVPA
jgi:glyoxylase-like metal-dependent hydrolase (beta-lactamase superfamily II)